MAVPLLLPINAFDIFFCIVKGVFIKHQFKISADVKAAAICRANPYIKLDIALRIYIGQNFTKCNVHTAAKAMNRRLYRTHFVS